MSADRTPLVSKLILLMLGLIFACLVVLINQQHPAKQQVEGERSPANANTPVEGAASDSVARPDHWPVRNRAVARSPAENLAPRPPAISYNYSAGEMPDAAQPATERQGEDASAVNTELTTAIVASSTSRAVSGRAEISGTVRLTGTPPPEIPIQLDATCGSLQPKPITTRHYVVTQDGRLANVLVYIKAGLRDLNLPLSTNQPVLDNTGCLFEPYVMGVQTGQKLKIKNSDPVLHNVHSTHRINNEFNVALPPGHRILERSFARPEIFVQLKCDVHPWMFAYVGVLAHPFFAVTDDEGAFRFPPGLPAGKYLVAAVHPKAGESVQEVKMREGEAKVLNFNLAVPNSQ